MSWSDPAVLPQLFAEYVAFGIHYVQDEIENRTSDLLSTREEQVLSHR